MFSMYNLIDILSKRKMAIYSRIISRCNKLTPSPKLPSICTRDDMTRQFLIIQAAFK